MNTQTINIPKALTVAFALAVGILVLLQVSRSAPAAAAPTAPALSSPKSINAARGTVLVTVLLKSNSLTTDLPKKATDLLTTTKGSTAARLAAQRNPFKRSESEAVAASIAENSRNAAIPMIRRAAAPGIKASELVQRKIRRLGGRVISASPIPNQIVARTPSSALPVIKRDPRVARIAAARLPVSLAAPLDGSAVWWTNGFTGQGPSLDGNGSPDAVVFDTGIRTTHDVFKSRLPGDCSTCLGSGPSRIVSPVIRNDFSGSKHANTIAAQIAGTAFTPSMNPAGQVGMAYGIDKLYDNYQATNPYLWDLGINVGSDTGLGGNTDLPEVINYSAGLYQNTVDLDPAWNYFDALESRFGILNTVSGGNCGIADPFYTNCGTGPHRVGTPGVNYNVLTMGGQDITANPADTSTYAPWPNSSPGPTWGGRKKPDLIGPVNGTAGTPSAIDDNTTTSFGYGTSFAAPVAAAGALLLASSGVYLPTAQKAIMVNSARPVQGQTYWTPRTGWGAINMDAAYYDRGNYVNSNVSGSGPNSARFFQVTGVANGDRATLVWNRRTNIDDLPNPTNGQISNPGYYALTNLDLTQFDPGTLAVTSSGGSDAADTVDTEGGDPDPVQAASNATSDNPMPGNGTDGGDNIEQIRSNATGTQILKVKSLSAVDGAVSEPFSIAASGPITALSTPIPEVTLATAPTTTGLVQDFTVTATVQNPSDDLPLDAAEVQLNDPVGTQIQSGDNPQPLGTIAPSGTAVATWTVQATSAGAKSFTATATGTSNDEDFSGEGEATINVDSTPPSVTVAPPPTYTSITSPTFNWTATDSESPVAGYDVDAAIDQGSWVAQLTNSSQTILTLTGAEGQLIRVRVRATDDLGNTSAWTEVSTTIDAIPPVVTFGTPDTSVRGTIRVPVFLTNAGSPVTGRFTFADTAGGRTGVVANGQYVTYKNITSKQIIANLRATATDALGRSASFSQDYSVQTRLAPNGMRVLSLSRVGSYVKITGSTQKTYNGKVTFSSKRIGKKGTKKASKRVTVKKGRFSIKIRVAKGRYNFTVSASATSKYAEASISKKLTVK
ncbi:MAG: hypothetical protein HYX29_01890 [Solirubrobacterales bacterium]|nr:hypothetical protein [Solirubrobacterales bacterium]